VSSFGIWSPSFTFHLCKSPVLNSHDDLAP
jgi:hypothetical protein